MSRPARTDSVMTRKEWRCTTFGRLIGLVLTVLAIGLDAGVSTAQGTGPGPAPGTLAGQGTRRDKFTRYHFLVARTGPDHRIDARVLIDDNLEERGPGIFHKTSQDIRNTRRIAWVMQNGRVVHQAKQ